MTFTLKIAEQTGWSVEISLQANQRKLDEAATEAGADGRPGSGQGSVFPNEPLVRKLSWCWARALLERYL